MNVICFIYFVLMVMGVLWSGSFNFCCGVLDDGWGDLGAVKDSRMLLYLGFF